MCFMLQASPAVKRNRWSMFAHGLRWIWHALVDRSILQQEDGE